jgi:predicted HTH domain antitoxin
MPLTITDDLLIASQMAEQDARLEIACRLYDAGKLTFPLATRWAGVSRSEFEEALLARNLPLLRLDLNDLKQDLETLQSLR